MAQQGLFTAGTSIEELLEKRRTRANALQQSLMANAAQGAARPMEAQAYSLLGSSLGRALAGGMEGSDKQMDTLKAEEANRQRLVGLNIKARQGSSAAMFAHAKVLNDDPSKRYTQAALDMTDKAVARKKEEDDAAAELAKQDKKKQVSGAYLNALQGTTNYEPTAQFNLDEDGTVTAIGRTGKEDTATPISTKSREIEEAYGFKTNTPEHQSLLQQALAIDTLSIGDIKSVTEGWRNETSQETDRISTANELLGLLELEGLDPKTKKISIVADRLVSRLFGGSDTKAQAEIETFRSTGDIGNKLASAATMFLGGTYNEDTLEGFKELAKFSLNRNVTSYNGKLVQAIKTASMASNLDEDKAIALFGEPMEMYVEPKKPKTNEGTLLDIGGTMYRSLGGDENDVDNWVLVEQ